MNIYYFVRHNGKVGEDNIPSQLKVLKYQRNLIIGGLKNKKEMMGVDCNNVVNGLKTQQFIEHIKNNKEFQTKNSIVTLSG